MLITAVFVICAVFAPWLAPYGFAQSSAHGVEFPKAGHPSSTHPFGTDRLFFDVLSRVIWGARTALEVVVLSILFCVVLGVPLGLLSGFYGGALDRTLVLIMDALYAFPSFLLAIVCSFLLVDVFGGSVIAVSLSLTVVYIPQYYRVVRNTTLSAKEATYIEAARAIGARDFRIMRKYLFGNVVHSVRCSDAQRRRRHPDPRRARLPGARHPVDPGGRVGSRPPAALADAGSGVWWTGLYPGLAIVFLVIGLTLVGEGLNETLNPTLRRRRLLPVEMPPRDLPTPAQEEQG